MFWQFGSRSETAAAVDVGAALVAAGVVATVGFVVAWLPPHAVAIAATNASATVIRPRRMPPGERFIDASSCDPCSRLIARCHQARPCEPAGRAPRTDPLRR